jgi:hypothetical protein
MKTKITILLLLAVCIGFWAGSQLPRRHSTGTRENESDRSEALEMIKSIINSKVALAEIRKERMTNAVELLEFEIDCNVSSLWSLSQRGELGSTRALAIQALRDVKAYRANWPRAVIRDAGRTEGLSASEIQKTVDEAATILNNL